MNGKVWKFHIAMRLAPIVDEKSRRIRCEDQRLALRGISAKCRSFRLCVFLIRMAANKQAH